MSGIINRYLPLMMLTISCDTTIVSDPQSFNKANFVNFSCDHGHQRYTPNHASM